MFSGHVGVWCWHLTALDINYLVYKISQNSSQFWSQGFSSDNNMIGEWAVHTEWVEGSHLTCSCLICEECKVSWGYLLRLFGSQLRSKTFKIVKNLLPGLIRKKLFSWLYLKRVEWRPPDLPLCSGQTSCSLVEAELRKRKSLDVPSSDYWYHVKEFKTITLFSSFLRLAEGESREALVTNEEKSDV